MPHGFSSPWIIQIQIFLLKNTNDSSFLSLKQKYNTIQSFSSDQYKRGFTFGIYRSMRLFSSSALLQFEKWFCPRLIFQSRLPLGLIDPQQYHGLSFWNTWSGVTRIGNVLVRVPNLYFGTIQLGNLTRSKLYKIEFITNYIDPIIWYLNIY